jgi:serine/threonine protein kinase
LITPAPFKLEPDSLPAGVETSTNSGRRGRTAYTSILKKFCFTPEVRGPWAVVGSTQIVQGWKLHVSSIPTEAVALLNSLLPVLQHHSLSFKTAKDSLVLEGLNEGSLGATQIGKFVTIYPGSNSTGVAVARELVELTQGFQGPRIVTDLRLGDVLYARYGYFNPIVQRDRLGQAVFLIHAGNGTLRVDDRPVPFKLPDGIPNPFGKLASAAAAAESQAARCGLEPPSGKLFGPGYLILDVVKAHPKGSVFLALDLRDQAHASARIIKQGRRHTFSDQHGRDMRTRLARQRALHQLLGTRVPIPQVDSYFELRGDGYLPLQYLEGNTLETVVSLALAGASWRTLSGEQRCELLSCMVQVVSAVSSLHKCGFVHRDLSPSNILITKQGAAYLLDLELAHATSDPSPPLDLGTPGFMSPQQQARRVPSYADDIYSLGCILTFMLTGLDPGRVLYASAKSRGQQIRFLANGAPVEIIAMAEQCVRRRVSSRPDLVRLATEVHRSFTPRGGQTPNLGAAEMFGDALTFARMRARARSLLNRAQKGILDDTIRDERSGLWLSPSSDDIEGTEIGKGSAAYELQAHAYRGIAGVLYVLARLARFGLLSRVGVKQARSAVRWLLKYALSETSEMPGLYFGVAGFAVALAEAVAGDLVARDRRVDSVIRKALRGRLDWPDITHGAAGQGVAALYCSDRLCDPSLLASAHRCARYLLETQKDDGSWQMPGGVEGMSGQTLTGFAHGVAGAAYFLCEHAFRFNDYTSRKAWSKAIDWLVQQAVPARNGVAVAWRYSDVDGEQWKWWCHGAPGIALALLKSYEWGGNPEHAALATKALKIHPWDLLDTRLSQCHGVSGIGEIYLEAARVLGDPDWLKRAAWIVQLLIQLRRERRSGAVSWLVEDSRDPTADLMIGSGGVIHFLLRFSEGAQAIGFPLLLDSVQRSTARNMGAGQSGEP